MKTVESPPRLYYLDWLRVLAMAGIYFFHNARFYDAFSDWHVRNATTSKTRPLREQNPSRF